jgi:uncharacterized membrane protein YhaH (DUF805 family)
MEWYLLPWQRFADFNGRARRKEYWTFTLVNTLIAIVLYVPALFMQKGNPSLALPLISLYALYSLASFIPTLSCSVRRLHDTGRSGFYLLLSFIPLVGLILIYILAIDSVPGSNEYGPNPKGLPRSLYFEQS